MNWTAILFAALEGALAAGIAGLLVGTKKERRVSLVVVTLVLFYGLKLFADLSLAPKVEVWQAEREIKKIGFYREIAENDPQTYEQMRAVLADSVKKKEPRVTTEHRMAALVSGSIPKYIGTASDDSVLSFIRSLTATLDSLHKSNPDGCYYYLFPLDRPNEPFAKVEVNDEDQSLKSMTQIVHSSVHSPQPLPNEDRAKMLMAPIVSKLTRDFGSDIALLQSKPTDARGRERVCAMSASMYSDILELPKSDGSVLIRFLLAPAPEATPNNKR